MTDRQLTTESLLCGVRTGDKDAMRQAVQLHLPLVHALLKRIPGNDQDRQEAFQNGCVGLILALKKFDPSYGVRFSTYAVPYILGEMRTGMRNSGALHVSRGIREKSLELNRLSDRLSQQLGHSVTLREISQAAGVDPEEAAFILSSQAFVQSLDTPADSDEPEAAEFAASELSTQEEAERHLLIRQAFSCLEPREARLMTLRYFEDRTQAETARALHISQVQVSRLEKKILLKIRRHLSG